MSKPAPKRCPKSLSRRGFLLGGMAGLAAGIPLGIAAWESWVQSDGKRLAIGNVGPKPGGPVTAAKSFGGMPGRYPGRVVEVHRPGVVSPKHAIDRAGVRAMLDRGIAGLAGARPGDAPDVWREWFQPDDVIGIKVNPVGVAKRQGTVGAVSNPEVILEVVRNLREAGVPASQIILFDRYANEFVGVYGDLMTCRELDGVRWLASAGGYSDTQLAINGDDVPGSFSPELMRHVVGYDPNSFVHMGFAAPEHSQHDERRYRSHVSVIVSRLINKLITIPVLKDHRSAGVTLSLKNMSHGLNNNVARSHIANIAHGYPDSPGRAVQGPNQCNTFIPMALTQPAIREKAALHILDGLIGVYEGGPGDWNQSWGTWRADRLLFATDPVALDHVGWDLLDRKRVSLGLPRVGEMGKYRFPPQVLAQSVLTGYAGTNALGAIPLLAADPVFRAAAATEAFDRRQPEHVYLAGSIGLGEYDLARIQHHRIQLG
ncbi:DUF362 domain-containing protein [Tuwongella immobilis]|uniref:DUF362 domain-containing protein n=1 Tax=Tuwongella immobilis TaxID=692036 RepID=A0A6C2YM66_9BACT|nr:DUF362 domain-containing protein [Tuwongella immobilis]VIP02526.1 Uncharacterized protein OS=Singulisphaera acidiphila (strain ATCC BAA-1392 / DSM 18658 / VKM B-2454 / MOB10) GN=Sinac_1122 PE=4 SV=1: DUF362 [Tuwongella immobilis]VTS01667.1 Uncharacterized protein OS=Singulisphaera acidiphila (strain ATCC BAA-1392 / DSM 18658 / VKM B-2454 / MOB10) GN=Sinac_1122 PE=4 SV=1: DUF362 [Tuwongella immobilis]